MQSSNPQLDLFEPHGAPASKIKKGILHTDGASLGNPGPSGIGVVLETEGQSFEVFEPIGIATNNVAEYAALIRGLKKALAEGVLELLVCIDSELLVKQLGGQYRVKDAKLKPLYGETLRLKSRFKRISIRHIPREENTRADALAKKAAAKTT